MSNLSSLILLNVYNLDPVFITFIEYRIDKPETKVYHSQIDVDLQFLFYQLSQIEKKNDCIKFQRLAIKNHNALFSL